VTGSRLSIRTFLHQRPAAENATIPPADSPQPVTERDHPGTVNEQQPWRHGWFKRRGTVPDPFPETVGTVAADLKRC